MKAKILRCGGKWLGAARTWIQWHKLNGSDVIWGSNTELRPSMTVAQVEDLAAEVTVAVIEHLIATGKLSKQFEDDIMNGLWLL
jgi:hypothetical protein